MLLFYSSADGQFEVKLVTKATLYSTGLIVWEPPAIYKSACIMDVEFFPFDIQKCSMKFGSWTYDRFEVDLLHVCAPDEDSIDVIDQGIDLRDFYENVEWDIVSVTAQKHIKQYICCIESYPDVTFYITMRRKTLFHTVNLILPCVVISFLTILVFYLPSNSEEKITLCISILLSLTVFFLLLTEIIPPTSIVIPLIGKYLLFTMILVTLSIIVTVFILCIHFRSPSTHHMSAWVKVVFLKMLPKLLHMRRPVINDKFKQWKKCNGVAAVSESSFIRRDGVCVTSQPQQGLQLVTEEDGACPTCNRSRRSSSYTAGVHDVLNDVMHISNRLKEEENHSKIVEDWKFVAMVLDRMFFWVFTSASLMGTFGILLQAPTIYDDRSALTADMFHNNLCQAPVL